MLNDVSDPPRTAIDYVCLLLEDRMNSAHFHFLNLCSQLFIIIQFKWGANEAFQTSDDFFYSFHGSVYLGGLDKLKQTTWVMQSSGQIIHRQTTLKIASAGRMMCFVDVLKSVMGGGVIVLTEFSWVVS